MFDRIILGEALRDRRGEPLAPAGFVISPEAIADAARRAPREPRRALRDTPLAGDLGAPLDDPAYAFLFFDDGIRDTIARVLEAARLPDALVDELLSLREECPALWRHGVATAAIAVRMIVAAVGHARGVGELAAAALLHDVGMRHLPPALLHHAERLGRRDEQAIAGHTLLGAFRLALALGDHPAVVAARAHHWRCGQGYPGLAAPPPRSVEVIGVASSFAALTQPRPFRSRPFDARGATDVLVQEAASGHADRHSVKLLVHALRGGRGDPRGIRMGHARDGHAPEVNRHTPVLGPERSYG